MLGLEERLHQHEPLFGGWYVGKEIGNGSFGRVYSVGSQDLFGTMSEAALKVIEIIPDQKFAGTPEALKQLAYDAAMTEVEVLRKLRGLSNVVTMDDHAVFEIKEDDRVIGYDLLIRMEKLENVGEILRSRERKTLQNVEEAKKLGKDICRGLILCHQREILHRDINPNNMFRNSFGDYKLGDFGIAKELDGTLHAKTAIGTKPYIAPEVLHRKTGEIQTDRYDARVDIYCLGLVLYQLTNDGYLPFYYKGMQKHEWKNAISRRINGETLLPPSKADKAFAQVILTACAYEPEERFGSAQEFYDALCALDMTKTEEVLKPVETGLDFWKPDGQDWLLHFFGLASVSTPEMRYMAEKLEDPFKRKREFISKGVLTRRMAARLPAWHIRQPWFPLNHLILRDYSQIADRAFYERSDLLSANIGGQVTGIGEEAFAHCNHLREFRCDTSVTTIGSRAFLEDSHLNRCQLSHSIQEMGEQAFLHCTSLASLYLPDALEIMPKQICADCTSLHQISLPSKLRYIEDEAFRGSGLQRIQLPNNCIQLGKGTFAGCKKLESVEFSLKLTTIPEECFSGCTSLAQLMLPYRLLVLGNGAFYGCTALQEVVLPEGVRMVGEEAFAHCENLRSIRIPNSVQEIGKHAFRMKGKRRNNNKLQVIAKRNSFAWQYCIQNQIKVTEP